MANSYNEAGQLNTQTLGVSLETRAFTYNILGAPDGINKNYARALNDDNWFGEEINYDYGFTPNRKDGQIAGTQWRSKGDGKQRAYGYTYDNAGRLTKADFSQKDGSWGTGAGVDYTLSNLSYDANGNILAMTQKGLKINSSSVIDSLVYSYAANSNQLLYVTDKANDTTAHLGDFTEINNNTTQDYWYDGNGNYTKDNNKGISAVSYNFMNLPAQISVTGKGTINYTYDATGNKLQKKITEGARVVTYLYSGAFLYKNDTLQYALTGEGRIRYLPSFGVAGGGPVYDYFVKDHLGNVRMVLTDEKDTAKYPLASLESANINTERLLYSGLDSGRVNKSTVPGYPSDGTTSPNDYIQQLSGGGYKIGSGIMLKVMSGDQVAIKVSSWYKKNGTTPSNPNDLAASLVANLINSLTGAGGPVHGAITSTQLQNSGLIPLSTTDFLNNRSAPDSTKPKAYLNWVLLDEQFKFVQNGSGAQQVGNDQEFKFHTATSNISKNGYLYVFVSNETPNINTFFDNLQVTHIKGPLLEESHYYPFGTEMSGISSHSLPSYVPNRYKANAGAEYGDEEWSNGSGLKMYETFYRSYNSQIGRFMQGDPKMEESMESYVFAGNNPVLFTDLLGDQKDPGHYSGPSPLYWRSNFFSYMDKRGNKWHHADYMIGTGAEGIPYTEGWGSDGFGDMTTGGGGGHVSKVLWSTNGGVEGYRIMWWLNGESGEGKTLDEVKFAMTFRPFSVGMQWDRWERKNIQQRNQGWETTSTILETISLSYETTEQGLIGAQKLGNRIGKTTSEILSAGKVGKIAGTGLGLLNLGVTVASGLSNKDGWENHHTADAVISAVEIGLGIFESTSPIGWAFGATMYVGNLISEHYTGKTITENLFDND